METFLYALHFIVCFVLIGVVLLQRGKGADLGASLGGGSANTIFGSRGAGNFLTKITTASAIVFMATSLSLSYLGYKASDVQLFDETEPFELPTGGASPGEDEAGGLQAVPDEAGLQEVEDGAGLVEIPAAAAVESAATEAADGVDAAVARGAEAVDAAVTRGAEAVEAAVVEGTEAVETAIDDAVADPAATP